MPQESQFPHLQLFLKGKFRAVFGSRNIPAPDQVKANREDRPAHVTRLRTSFDNLRRWVTAEAERRRSTGSPVIEAGVGFVMQVPEGVDPDDFAHALGVELVAESEGGYLLVSSQDITLEKLEEVLSHFERHEEGGARAASLLEIFEKPDDRHRLERILSEQILQKWPFVDDQDYIFDVSIQTAEGTHSFSIPTVQRRNLESDEDFQKRKEAVRQEALVKADAQWTVKSEQRFDQITSLIEFHRGVVLVGLAADEPVAFESVIKFADSFQVRLRVNGKGWRDIIMSLPNIFEVALPDDVEQPLPANGLGKDESPPEFAAPPATAPAVCVIDSGIQEGHIWLQSAIDSATSHCFLPNRATSDVGDEAHGGGHGTRVAGAILYPNEIPRTGRVELSHWLQNARVLDANKQVPVDLPPAKYIEQTVVHFKNTAKKTRLYNHSIAGNCACAMRRMSTWATKMDELSHRDDVLFIQAAGNLRNQTAGTNNPGVFEHLQAGRVYPVYLEEPSAALRTLLKVSKH